MKPTLLTPADASYPARLRASAAAPEIWALGDVRALASPLTAFFCSAKCPGDIILRSHDAATRWRDEGRVIVSGFHSPVERDCLRILLRGKQPIIICPARTLAGFRVPAEWQAALDASRLLVLSPFASNVRRTSARLAAQRNEFAASLADEIHIAYATPGGSLEQLARRFPASRIPSRQPLSLR